MLSFYMKPYLLYADDALFFVKHEVQLLVEYFIYRIFVCF